MTNNKNIDIFALTDSHQEARKLCCLFSSIIKTSKNEGENTLICDGGDIFKGIYDRELSVNSYLKVREKLPYAKIVVGLGNNDFGFNIEQFEYLKKTISRLSRANINILCANLRELKTNKIPEWISPYTILEMNNCKVLITSFCISEKNLQKQGLYLTNVSQTFFEMLDTIKHINPDFFIVLNHDLYPCSKNIVKIANENNIKIDLLVGGHEHTPLEHDKINKIYYPRAFGRNMLRFIAQTTPIKKINFKEEIVSKFAKLLPCFEKDLIEYENKSGLYTPIAKSILHLEKDYSNPCSLGSFITDKMKKIANTDIAILSTGYLTHALRYEKNKMLTLYNLERAYSAPTILQVVELTTSELKTIFENSILRRHITTSNTQFLQCSQNISIIYRKKENELCEVIQIYINQQPLLDNKTEPIHNDKIITCAMDQFIASGELGYNLLKYKSKETLMKNNQLVIIRDIFFDAIKKAEKEYSEGYCYPTYKLSEL